MAAFTSIGSDDWDDGPNTWGTLAGVYPGASAPGDTVVIADGHVVDLNVSPANTIATITNTGNTGYITCDTDQTLLVTGNPAIAYGGTSTSGFIRVTANTLTITHNQGAGTVAVSATDAGYAIKTSVTGALTISNSGGTAAAHSSGGRAISTSGSGALNITGDVDSSGAGAGVWAESTSVSSVWAGSATASSTGQSFRVVAGTVTWTPGTGGSAISSTCTSAVYVAGGTLVINAVLVTANTSTTRAYPVWVAGGTVTYVGDYTLADEKDCVIGMTSGTLNLATATDNLVLTNNGSFVILLQAGALTYNADGGTASIVNAKSTSYAAIIGGSTAQKGIIASYSSSDMKRIVGMAGSM